MDAIYFDTFKSTTLYFVVNHCVMVSCGPTVYVSWQMSLYMSWKRNHKNKKKSSRVDAMP